MSSRCFYPPIKAVLSINSLRLIHGNNIVETTVIPNVKVTLYFPLSVEYKISSFSDTMLHKCITSMHSFPQSYFFVFYFFFTIIG